MQPLSRILVGVDFSDTAFDAFEYALTLGSRHDAELVVVHAVPPGEPFSWHARARVALHEQLRLRAARAKVAFEERVQSGDPAEIVLLHARTLQPDVIVVGTHQRRGVDRLRRGSVAARVVARATVPVLLVPRHRHRQTKATQPFRHVAVAVDFSARSEQAIEHALALAGGPGDRITLIHVVPGAASGAMHTSRDVEPHEAIDVARARLHAAVPLERTAAVIEVRVRSGQPAAEIRRVIPDIGADLLVVGTRKRGLLSRALFGTTSSQLLDTVRVPVLTVPDTAEAPALERATAMRRAA